MASFSLNRDTPTTSALKGFSTAVPLFIFGALTTTSIQFIPSLLLSTQYADAESRSKGNQSGRLTPAQTPTAEKGDFSLPLQTAFSANASRVSSGQRTGHKIAAQQFALMSKASFATAVPLELLTIATSGYIAYRSYNSFGAWQKWAAICALVTSVFPLTGALMAPLDLKLARIAGVAEKVEPYEDSPPDREAEKINTQVFLGKWNQLNLVRSAIMGTAGVLGLWSLLE